jgi:hypothetical protein
MMEKANGTCTKKGWDTVIVETGNIALKLGDLHNKESRKKQEPEQATIPVQMLELIELLTGNVSKRTTDFIDTRIDPMRQQVQQLTTEKQVLARTAIACFRQHVMRSKGATTEEWSFDADACRNAFNIYLSGKCGDDKFSSVLAQLRQY